MVRYCELHNVCEEQISRADFRIVYDKYAFDNAEKHAQVSNKSITYGYLCIVADVRH